MQIALLNDALINPRKELVFTSVYGSGGGRLSVTIHEGSLALVQTTGSLNL